MLLNPGHSMICGRLGTMTTSIILCPFPHRIHSGLARIAGLMANEGSFDDFRFLSPATVTSFHADPTERFMIYCSNYFVQGGVSEERLPSSPSSADHRIFEGMEGYFGWGGYGGSQMQWHPEEKIAFAFVPSYLFWIDIGNQRGRRLQREVLRCARNLKQVAKNPPDEISEFATLVELSV